MLIERERVLRGNFVLPSAEDLEELGKAVSVLRGRVRTANGVYLAPEQLQNDERKKLASDALQILADVLPALREEILGRPDVVSPEISDAMRFGHLSQIDALQMAVAAAMEYVWLIPHQELSISISEGMARFSDAFTLPPPSPISEIQTWHHFVSYLADKFRDVVQTANPTLPRLRIGNGESANPVVRFLAAVIPHITGEEPKPDAIRKWLQRSPAGDKPT